MAPKRLIGYVRVSTAKQGHSGLGIEAQKEALERFGRPEQPLAIASVDDDAGSGLRQPSREREDQSRA